MTVKSLWLSARELADMRLPGLPADRAGILRKARLEAWPKQEATRRGQVVQLFPVDVLPQQAQAALQSPRTATTGAANDERLPSARFSQAIAKARVVAAWQTSGQSMRAFVAAWNGGGRDFSDTLKGMFPVLSVATVSRWVAAAAEGGVERLKDNRGRKPGSTAIDDEVAEAIIAILGADRIPAADVLFLLRKQWSDRPLPSVHQIKRFISRIEAEKSTALLAHRDPHAFKARKRMALGRADADVTRPNERWEIDSSPTDIMLRDDDGSTARWAIIGLIDVATRRAMMLLSPSSRSLAIATLVRRACLSWGMPETIKTDNGKDYVSRHLREGIASLGIRQVLCPPFSPEKKPHIERFFGTFQRAGLFRLLPGFIGANTRQRQAIRERARADGIAAVAMSPMEFQAWADAWVEQVYHQRRHGSLGRSPQDALRQHVDTGWSPVLPPERALDPLLQPIEGSRQVRRTGIDVRGASYWSSALTPYLDQTVTVRTDEADLGRIFVYSLDGAFLGEAQNFRRKGVSQAAVAAAAKAEQAREVRATRDRIKAANRQMGGIDRMVREVLTQRIEANAAAADPAVAKMPQRHEASGPAPTPGRVAAMPQRAIDDTQLKINATRRAIEICDRIAAGQPVDDHDRAYAESFCQGATFKSWLTWLKENGEVQPTWTPPVTVVPLKRKLIA